MSTSTWLRAVQEADYVLENIETKTSTTPRDKSWSVLKVKLAALEMRVNPRNVDVEDLLADIPRGERNRHPMEKHYSIQCPSFGLENCTKTFFVEKKSFDLLPINSDGTMNQISVNWYNHFKGMYDTKKIPHLVLKMADNHL